MGLRDVIQPGTRSLSELRLVPYPYTYPFYYPVGEVRDLSDGEVKDLSNPEE